MKHDTRKNLKITPKLDDELRYLSKSTGKSKIQILSEYLDSMLLCASAYRNFIYYIHIHSPESIEIKFVGSPALISGSCKVTSPEQVKSIERNMIQQVEKLAELKSKAKVQKGMSFSDCVKLMKTKPKEVKKNGR